MMEIVHPNRIHLIHLAVAILIRAGKSQSSSSKSVMKDKAAPAVRARQSSVSVCDDDEDIEETSDRPEAIVLDVGVHVKQNIIPV